MAFANVKCPFAEEGGAWNIPTKPQHTHTHAHPETHARTHTTHTTPDSDF